MSYEEEDACNDRRVQGVAHKHGLRITTRITSAIFDAWRERCCCGVSTPRRTRKHTEDTPAPAAHLDGTVNRRRYSLAAARSMWTTGRASNPLLPTCTDTPALQCQKRPTTVSKRPTTLHRHTGTQRRVPSPNRYMAFARFCFCKNNKRTININDTDTDTDTPAHRHRYTNRHTSASTQTQTQTKTHTLRVQDLGFRV